MPSNYAHANAYTNANARHAYGDAYAPIYAYSMDAYACCISSHMV